MALSDIFQRTRSLLSGPGMGSKPSFRRAHSAATVASTSGGLATFFLASSTEGGLVSPGDVLSVYSPSVEGDAHCFYVLSVSTTAVTAVNGYGGAPLVSGSTDLDSALLEQNATWTGYDIFEAIDTVISNQLWPWVFDVNTTTIAAPDITFGTEAVPAEAERIISAHQIIGGRETPVDFSNQPLEVHTSIASTGKLAHFNWINGTTGYITYISKYAEADEADTELTHLIALGAAAILLGAAITETTMESSKKDNAEAVAQRGSAGDRLWRDFLTLRQNMSEELGRRLPNRIYVNRG